MPLLGTVGNKDTVKNLTKKRKRSTRPTAVFGTVPPRKPLNVDRRPREYLTPKEVERLIAAARNRNRRYGLRDATMILVASGMVCA